MNLRFLRRHIILGTWAMAGLWLWRAVTTRLGLRHVPDLLEPAWDTTPEGEPLLAVIVPARDEADTIEAGLTSLLRQDYRPIHVIAVDDRSTDSTAQIMDRLAQAHPARLSVLRITDLPSGWLGKTHAMAIAARHAQAHLRPEWMLFTDADIQFSPDALRRCLTLAVCAKADHLVTLPTPIIRRLDEAVFLGFFQVMSLWAVRLWRVADPNCIRDTIGVGAFALLRTSAYRRIGGFESLRMEILEDLYLGRRVKQLGLRQRVAFGRGLVRVHWARGAMGLVGVLTKNLFALFRFRLSLVLFASFWLAVFSLGPLFALAVPEARIPAILIAVCVAYLYRVAARYSGISAWNFLLAPLAGSLLVYSVLRSTWTTLSEGGVRWRGTFYSLQELRDNAGPLLPRRLKAGSVELGDQF